MLKYVEVTAPGKLILLGEHAVVYGKTALACSVQKHLQCSLQTTSSPLAVTIRVHSPEAKLIVNQTFDRSMVEGFAGFSKDVKTPKLMDPKQINALQLLISSSTTSKLESKLYEMCLFFYLGIASNLMKDRDMGIIIDIKSELPFGAGLGSSASLNVSLATAFLLLCQFIVPQCQEEADGASNCQFSNDDLQLINSWAFQGELIAHGKPSGIDNSVVTYGGVISYKSGKIEKLMSFPQIEVILVHTKVCRSTSCMVSRLRERHDNLPKVYDAIFDAIESLVEEWKSLLESGNIQSGDTADNKDLFDKFVELTDLNQGLLRTVGVSHHAIEAVLGILLSFGFKGKLTGAGGGGCLFAIVKPDVDDATVNAALDRIQKSGFDCWRVNIGGDGVKCHDFVK